MVRHTRGLYFRAGLIYILVLQTEGGSFFRASWDLLRYRIMYLKRFLVFGKDNFRGLNIKCLSAIRTSTPSNVCILISYVPKFSIRLKHTHHISGIHCNKHKHSSACARSFPRASYIDISPLRRQLVAASIGVTPDHESTDVAGKCTAQAWKVWNKEDCT